MQKVLSSAQQAMKNYQAIAFRVRSACGILTTRKEKTNKVVMCFEGCKQTKVS